MYFLYQINWNKKKHWVAFFDIKSKPYKALIFVDRTTFVNKPNVVAPIEGPSSANGAQIISHIIYIIMEFIEIGRISIFGLWNRSIFIQLKFEKKIKGILDSSRYWKMKYNDMILYHMFKQRRDLIIYTTFMLQRK